MSQTRHRPLRDFAVNILRLPLVVRREVLLHGDLRARCHQFQFNLFNSYYAKSALRMGSFRRRLPVAAKIALATAGAIAGVLASPIPPGASVLATMYVSISGISSMRITSYVLKFAC